MNSEINNPAVYLGILALCSAFGVGLNYFQYRRVKKLLEQTKKKAEIPRLQKECDRDLCLAVIAALLFAVSFVLLLIYL